MCGIIGILGTGDVVPRLIAGLKRLEYRGYDSAGIATACEGRLVRRRAVGKLANLTAKLQRVPLASKSGIGHTRWATHGAATESNSHPHQVGPVAVVHNGIIENFRTLRAEIAKEGLNFASDTDTETIAALTRRYLESGCSAIEAVHQTLPRLEGAFALAFLFEGEDDLIIVARRGSPLAIGHGTEEMYVGSDALVLSPLSSRITYLEEGDSAVITRQGVQIYDAGGQPCTRRVAVIEPQSLQVDKEGHRHFMAKEIAEQPRVIARAIAHYQGGDSGLARLQTHGLDFANVERLVMVACGTAYYACLTAKYWFEKIARLPVEVDMGSEFRYRAPPVSRSAAAIVLSQSGETADTLAALRYCRGKAGQVVSLVNVEQSSVARASDVALSIFAGVEIGVASTKAFTCQLAVLLMMALQAAQARSSLPREDLAKMASALRDMPAILNSALGLDGQIAALAKELAAARDVLFMGRGLMYPLALEAALKMKETSYIHAEAYPAGELKHGPIALIDAEMPVVVIAPTNDLFAKTISNMEEVMARGGKVVLITDSQGAKAAGEGVWRVLTMPAVHSHLAPLLYALPAQLLAYHVAVARGTDVDQPRNLAKSVTVE
ncbi:MAG: glutamine--fructose-6-phosphate transaminase (isomerizing) [Rhodobacteraceae bacterium]|nr:glutamine--fructose-6-phosphate transaminase (isomerizing) [Paracoccaceae bacterium]